MPAQIDTRSTFHRSVDPAIRMVWKASCLSAALLVPAAGIAQKARTEKQVIYLVGDAGEAGENGSGPVFGLLGTVAAGDVDAKRTLVYLGDNLYPLGLHKKGHPMRAQDETNLMAQVTAANVVDGRTYFIPGNHDWAQGDKHGLKYILRQALFIQDTSETAMMLPKGGCPGPEVVELGDKCVLIAIDSQWWLQQFQRGEGERDGCGVQDEEGFLAALNATLYEYRDRRIIVAGHHPLYSQGRHGGHYPLRDHLFPLTNLSKGLWIPLPVIGSIYPMYRGLIGNVQDMAHERYTRFRIGMEAALTQYPGVVYASGHEHVLQYIQEQGVHHIVSGTGSRTSYLARSKRLAYGKQEKGFARLTVEPDGSMRLDEFTVAHGATPDASFNLSGPLVPEMEKVDDRPAPTMPATATVAPNEHLKAGWLKRAFLGSLNRDVWCAPITVPVIDLDTAYGGLKAKGMGGGKQTRSLRLKANNGHDYVMRSIKKYPALALEPAMRGTVVERIVDDGIAGSNPYSGVVMGGISDAVKVYHTDPRLVYLPDHPALGRYRETFSNTLCLLEERTDGDWSGSHLFGGTKDLASSGALINGKRTGHKDILDDHAMLRARLLDMLIGDWDRHDDQWRWATFKHGDSTIYRPVPRDRDQAFFIQNGLLPYLASRPWAISKFQSFGPKIHNIAGQNFNARYLDRAYLTRLDRATWRAIADSMKNELTDEVIETSIARFPDTTYRLIGQRIIAGLKGRRDKLPEIADKYYLQLAKNVDVVGTDDDEFFEVKRLDNDRTEVNMYARKHGKKVGDKLYFHRVFHRSETKEIRIYGLEGNDEYHVKGNVGKAIKLRIIGGMKKDVIEDSSRVSGLERRTIVYESGGLRKGNKLRLGKEARLVRAARQDALDYDRREFVRDVLAPLVVVGLNPDDGPIVGAGFRYTKQGFKVDPFRSQHRFTASIATLTSAWRVNYTGRFNQVIGRLDMGVDAAVLAPSFNYNFFGFGNRTPLPEDKAKFQYRVDLIEVAPYLARRFGGIHEVRLTGIYWSVKQGKLSVQQPEGAISPQDAVDYAGARLGYTVRSADHLFNPGRGMQFHAELDALNELNSTRQVLGAAGDVRFYIPARIFKARTVFALRAAAGRRDGDIDPLTARQLGGQDGMRGLRRTRFSGNSMAVANFEVRQDLFSSKNHFVPFRFGLIGFADGGRVWVDGLNEHYWHTAAGGGFYISPLDMLTLQTTYGVSDDAAIIDIRLGFFF